MTATATPPFSVIPLGDLVESKTNPRRQFDKKALDELAESIAAHGVLQPILVRPAKKGYEIVAGARRFRASQKAKVAGVPCIVRDLDDKQVLEVQVIENLQREDVHPLEEGVGFRTLHTKHGYTVEDLAAKLGKSKAFVYQRMKLAELPAKVQKLFLAGRLETSHAVLVARIPDPKLAEKAAAEISRRGFDGRPIAYRNAVDLVRREFQCDLSSAPFPTADAELVPGVGACGPCPKRTGNLRGLFDDVDKDERSNVCTDPKCFAKKAAAQWAVRKAEVAKVEGTVIEGKAAFNARHDSRYVNPDDTDWHSPGNKKWKTMCRGREPKTVLIQGRDGEALERWDRREALAAAKANGHKVGPSPRSSSSSSSQETKRRKTHARRMKVVDEVAPLVGKQAEQLASATAWRLVIELLGPNHNDGRKRVGKRRGLELVSKTGYGNVPKATLSRLKAMKAHELQAIALEILALDRACVVWSSVGYEQHFVAVCRELGVGYQAVDKRLAAAERKPSGKKVGKKAAGKKKAKARPRRKGATS